MRIPAGQAIKRGQELAFAAGHEAIEDILTPAQQRAESQDGPSPADHEPDRLQGRG